MDPSNREASINDEKARELPHIAGLGPFRWINRLGVGGQGEVWLAESREGGQFRAIKRARPGSPSGDQSIQREYLALSTLAHPGIPKVFECGTTFLERQAWYAMELLRLQPLDEYLRAATTEDRLQFCAQALRTLEFIHGCGWFHGDVKPENFMLSGKREQPEFKLIDFSFAGEVGQDESGWVRTTLDFAAPEVLEGRGATPSSDLFSLGRTLEELGFERELGRERFGLLGQLTAEDPRSRCPSASLALESLRPHLNMHRLHPPAQFSLPASFRGRARELAIVKKSLESLAQGTAGPSFLVIAGEAGSGRTRLLKEATRGVEFQGIRVCWLRSCIDAEQDLRVFDRACAQEGASVSRLLVLDRPEEATLSDLESLLRSLQCRYTSAGTWMLIATRDRIDTTSTLGAHRELRIERLAESDIQKVLDSTLPVERKRSDEVEKIARGSEGLPGLALAALDSVLRADQPLAVIDDHLMESTPSWLVENARQSLRRVGMLALKVAARAAILYPAFDLQVLRAMAVHPDEEEGLSELLEAGILYSVPGGPIEDLEFRSDTVRRILLGDLERKHKVELHTQAARAIEDIRGNEPAYSSRAAQHWRLAGHVEESFLAGSRAVRFHLARNEPNTATDEWRRLDGLRPHLVPRFLQELRGLQGDCLLQSSKAREALEVFQSLLRESVQPDKQALWLRKSAAALTLQGLTEGALKHLLQARKLLQGSSDWEEKAKTCEDLAPVLSSQGRVSEARAYLLEALECAQRSESWKLKADIQNDLGVVAYFTYDYATSRDHHELALELRQIHQDRDGIARSKMSLAGVEFMTGQFECSGRLQAEAAELKTAVGDQAGNALARLNLAEVDIVLGRYAKARRVLEGLEGSGDLGEERRLHMSLYEHLSVLWIHKAEYSAAWACLEEATEIAEQVSLSDERRAALDLVRASFHLRTGELIQGRSALECGMRRSVGAPSLLARFTSLAAHYAVELEGRLARESAPLKREGLGLSAIESRLSASCAAFASGDSSLAREHAQAACDMGQTAGARHLLSECQLAWARLMDLDRDAGRISHLAHEILEFAKLESLRELRWQAQHLLGRLHARSGRVARALSWYRMALSGIQDCLTGMHREEACDTYLALPLQSSVLKEFRSLLRTTEERTGDGDRKPRDFQGS